MGEIQSKPKQSAGWKNKRQHQAEKASEEEVPQRELVCSWTVDEVADELEKRGCKNYGLQLFKQNIDGYDLFALGFHQLKEMGFTDDHAHKLLRLTTSSLGHGKADEMRDLL